MLRKNPLASIHRGYMENFLRLAQEFGLTPSSRGRLGSPPPSPEVDDDFEFLFGPKG